MTDTYTPPTIANYNDNPPDDDGTVSSDNLVEWAKHISEIGNPLKNYIDAVSAETDDGFERVDARNARSILEFDADPTGVTSSQTALDNARTWLAAQTDGATLIFPTGIYSYSTSPNWALQDCRIIANGTVRLRYSGAGNAVILDGGGSGGGIYNVEFGPFIIEAPSTAANGLYMRSVHHCTIKVNVRGCGTSSSGIYMEWGVCNTFIKPTVSVNEDGSWYSSGKPAYGIYLTDRGGAGASVQAAANNFITPIIEGCDYGIYIDYGSHNQFFGGTSEGCTAWGASIVSPSANNKFIGVDFESNTTGDIGCAGAETDIISCETDQLVQFLTGGQKSKIIGGSHHQVTIDSGVNGVQCISHGINRNSGVHGTGTITNGGLFTRISNVVNVVSNITLEYQSAAADDTTPSVLGCRVLNLPSNSGATAITQLDDGVAGQVVTLVVSGSSNIATITDGGNFALSGNWTPGQTDTLTLTTLSGTSWLEVSRSNN